MKQTDSSLDINYENIFKKSATKAGQRYMPFVSPDMPNVKLKYINYLNAISLNNSFVDDIKNTIKHIEEYNYDTHQNEAKKTTEIIDPLIKHLYLAIKNISFDITDLSNINELKGFIEKLIEITNKRKYTHSSLRYEKDIDKSKKERYSYIQSKYEKLSNSLEDIKEQFDYFISNFETQPYMLIVGEAGIGKTHFLLDSTKMIIDADSEVIIFLGEFFKNDISMLETIKQELKVDLSDTNFLEQLNNQAMKKNTRFSIIIDAVNEIDVSSYMISSKLDVFMNRIKEFKNIAVILSCRTPYQHQVIPHLQDFHIFELPGLPQKEALKQFSLAFDIQPIELPYIMHELSNPLFLKTMYETITLRKNRDDTVQVSTLLTKGNESLKELFEKYIYEHSINVFKNTKHKKILWVNIIKPICELNFNSLLKNKLYELDEAKVIEVIESSISKEILEEANLESGKSLLDLLVNIGIFRRDIDYRTRQQVIKITYQKLYDYLMARYIFSVLPYIKQNTKEEVSEAYESLLRDFHYFSFTEAIIVEFPTRNKQTELFDYLSQGFLNKHDRNLLSSFISGLLWRSNNAFTDRTKHYINKSLQVDFDTTLEILFILSTKPSHPFTSKTFDFLNKQPMQKRDLAIGRFLKYRIDDENPIGLYIDWLYDHDKSKINVTYAQNIFNYLQWFLSLPMSSYRDKVTNIIVDVGSYYPKELFEHVQNNIELNDDYIRERLVSALYGVMMRHKDNSSICHLFEEISLWLYEKFFINFTTYNIVILDSIKSIIELTLEINPSLCVDKDKIFNFKIPQQKDFWKFPECSRCKSFLKSQSFSIEPMRMDFTNYTIGNRIKGRPNYGHTNDYDKAVLYINNRVFELGWNAEEFKDVDREFSSSYGGRIGTQGVERYGKKYSWIAYNEYMGYLTSIGYFNPRKDEYSDDESFDRFWEQTSDVSYPDIKKFINGDMLIDELSLENIKGEMISNEWVMIFCFARSKKGEWKEYFVEANFNEDINAHNNLGTVYGTHFGELFWSETILESKVSDLCLEYSSGDYNTEYSQDYSIKIVTKEFAQDVGIKVDLINSKFVDSSGKEAIKIYKFNNDIIIQEFTFLRKDLLQEYQKKHDLKLYASVGMNDNEEQSNDFQEIIELDLSDGV